MSEIFIELGIQTGMFLLFLGLSYAVPRLPKKMSNFPGKVKVEKLPEEAQKRVYQWVHSSTAIFLFVIDIPENLLQLFILLTTIKVALGEWEGLNGGIFVSLIACIVICALICIAWMFWKINRLVESEGKLKGG